MPPLRPRLLPTARSRLAAAPPGSIDWFGLSPRYPGIKRFAASLCLGSGVRALSGRCHLLLSALASPPLPLSAPQGIRPARSSEALLFGGRLLSPGRRERRAEHVALCLAGAMAPQRRAAPRGPESGGTAGGPGRGGRRHSSAKKSRGQQESRWRWLKAAVLLFSTAAGGLLSWSYLRAEDGVTEVLARHSENLQDKFVEIPCSEDYDSHKRFEGCTPRKCGRGVTDAVITREEAERIRRIAERGLSLGGSDGGASILDLHSGALSLGKHFVNLYSDVRQRIQQRIAQAFGISSASMYLTKPTFFSRINNTEAKTTHDEYWHPHVDKVTYGSFDYTSLLYLSDYTEDFGGGRFVFMDAGSNKTIEPRAGRVSFFTSGSENLHRVEKVHWGTRYAITISFTCNPDHGIGDPVLM
ncbi:2-oxoglutarate and iron-dependent oxygenase domain-containing protein 3 isoform X3 [Harpia harpyja]|uniref:2-oxoglutarate and iron-dependent oxygenase domain-containing protein 3 isoform X3 n=1 Tax=Harpia harpyja TaxID=202280 RepID=UPI0022B1075A|nr:2-oxoglutarate and iron-dependent oxygenase domain-containing protein 3 isoform X3 [Harpia harpyja]